MKVLNFQRLLFSTKFNQNQIGKYISLHLSRHIFIIDVNSSLLTKVKRVFQQYSTLIFLK